jgi:hypothetical protein
VKQGGCPAGRASRVSARRPTYLFCFAVTIQRAVEVDLKNPLS